MTTRARIRRTIDFGRLREAMSAPGADPRPWVLLARVDDDDDAIRFDEGVGWIVDVTICYGDLAGEGPIACRLASEWGKDGGAKLDPPTRGAEVVIEFPQGDTNGAPFIRSVLFNRTDVRVPASVNGTEINEEYALATHIIVSPHALDAQYGSRARLTADELLLATSDAAQAYVRGNDQKDALSAFLDALDTFIPLVQAGIIAGGGSLDTAAILAAIVQLRQGLTDSLSTKIKGA